MSRRWVALVVIVVAAAAAAAVLSRRGDPAPKPRPSPAASQKVGDTADVMRRLQRKKLVAQR